MNTLVVVTSLLAVAGVSGAEERPNIVFILADDLGYADVGFHGQKSIRTPHLDKLAAGGAVLEAHYVQPVCSPTRAALLTGRYPTRTGVYTVIRPASKRSLPLNERTLAQALKDAGYETAIVGKWHLGSADPAFLPTARGFDRQYGHFFGALDYFTHVRDGKPDWYRDDKPLEEEGYTTELLAREACRRIAERDESKRLFLYVPFNAVHTPNQVPERYKEPYAHMRPAAATYAGMVAALDDAVGKIAEAIETKGMAKSTLIVFSSDNGGTPRADNGPLRGRKGSIWEGGVRASAFVCWPGKIPAGARIREPMHIADWYPTLIRLAGGSIEQPLPVDGLDVWSMLTEGARSPHESILLAGTAPGATAVRAGDWKLIVRREDGAERVELYDLAKDAGETEDRAAQEAERVAAMRTMLDAHLDGAAPPIRER